VNLLTDNLTRIKLFFEENITEDEGEIFEETIDSGRNKTEAKRNVPKLIVSIHPAERVTGQPRKLVVSTNQSNVFLYFGRENTGEVYDQELIENREDDDDGQIYDKVLTKYDRKS
jgi:hypothetical protein